MSIPKLGYKIPCEAIIVVSKSPHELMINKILSATLLEINKCSGNHDAKGKQPANHKCFKEKTMDLPWDRIRLF